MKKSITNFIRSIVGSSPKVSQICIGNGNIQCRGNVSAGEVIINGKKINLQNEDWLNDDVVKGNVKIEITGDVNKIDIPAGNISINGNVTGDVTTSQGNIEIGGDVEGNVKNSMGDITIKGKHSGGNVSTSMGDVNIKG